MNSLPFRDKWKSDEQRDVYEKLLSTWVLEDPEHPVVVSDKRSQACSDNEVPNYEDCDSDCVQGHETGDDG